MKDSVDEIKILTMTTSILKNVAFNLADISVSELAGGITASVIAGDYWASATFLFSGGNGVKEIVEYLKWLKEVKRNQVFLKMKKIVESIVFGELDDNGSTDLFYCWNLKTKYNSRREK